MEKRKRDDETEDREQNKFLATDIRCRITEERKEDRETGKQTEVLKEQIPTEGDLTTKVEEKTARIEDTDVKATVKDESRTENKTVLEGTEYKEEVKEGIEVDRRKDKEIGDIEAKI